MSQTKNQDSQKSDTGTISIKDYFVANARQYGIYLALVAIILLFQFLTGGTLLKPNNFVALFQQNAYVMILAVGMLIIIIGTHIDLSVGSVVAFIGGLGAYVMAHMHLNWFITIIMMLAVGLLVGLWQGFWVAYVGVPAFVTTLGGMLIFRGLATHVAGQSIPVDPNSPFVAISSNFLPNIFGFWGPFDGLSIVVGVISIILFVLIQIRKRNHMLKEGLQVEPSAWMNIKLIIGILIIGFATYLFASSGNEHSGGIPIILVVIGVVVSIYMFILNKMVLGREIYAVGGNRKAAILSGINSKAVDMKMFLNMGLLASIAGIVDLSRFASASAQAGTGYELDAIAACFIGGAAVAGGVGKIPGALVGALIMGVLNMGLSILGVSSDIVSIIKGLVVIVAVAYDLISKRRKA
ncbi:sugar ABC transporter permease [Lactococcus hircilactis]|uniref:Xylose transport system permease protein XylH n=1 Tax=Lactococcus hircilactis TaxID=1494462 RepID=A0A7X2D0M5_9LACT|nr:multiple monosaccharide ABC transporter permease [Lactococcus hircilactis]MQW38587.1 sugar ABC transporter permease [Lactococcus hircilactis]